jgi:tRNA dimethylallyltransferase
VDARAALAAVERAGRLPIVVGGTGLYFKALTQGLAAVPPIPADIRSAVRDRLKGEGIAPTLCGAQRSRSCDRAASRAGRSRPRHARSGGGPSNRPLALDWHREGMAPALDADGAVKIFLDADPG